MPHTETLVWVNANKNSETQKRLVSMGLTLTIFSDLNDFIDYITRNATERDSVTLIISGSLGQQLVPMIEFFPQLRTIYIYGNDATKHIYWAKQYDKIGVNRIFSEENDLIARLTADLKITTSHEFISNAAVHRIFITEEQNKSTISIFSGIACNKSTRDLTEEKMTFVWLQLLNDILLNMPPLPTARDEMLTKCRQICNNDRQEMDQIDEFYKTYTPEKAINWYTREAFLYRLLNEALRTEDIDIIFQFRMIIIDLCRQLTKLFESTTHMSPTLTVYRGQRMAPSEIRELKDNISGFFSMNSFVSTTLNEGNTRRFLEKSKQGQNEQTVAVLFKLILDVEIARKTNKPFANISKFSEYSGEEEILLVMGTVFRVEKVEEQTSDLWHVTATMCTFLDEPEIERLFNFFKTEIYSHERMTYSTYGKFLALMSNFDSSINYLTNLLAQQSIHLHFNNIELATIHNDLAYAYRDSFRYPEALEHYEVALDLKRKSVPLDEIDLATTYSDMGWLLMNTKDLNRARSLHQDALDIRKRYLINNPSDIARSEVAMSLNCLGLVLAYMSELNLAKKYLQESLDIRKSCLPPKHPYTAMSYSSLGSYFELIGNDDEALKMHERALAIYKSSVPPTHQILRSSNRSVGEIYLKQGKWQEAIVHLKAVLTFNRNLTNITRVTVLSELGKAYFELRNYQCALKSCQDALMIAKNIENNTLISKLTKMIELVKSRS